MLSKKQRLTRTGFTSAFSAGKRMHTPTMQVIICPSDSFHASVVVPKKVYKNAVDRNKLRRKIYAVLYEQNKKKPFSKTVIIIVKPSIKGIPSPIVKASLLTALESV